MKNTAKGKIIVIEGVDGSGKATQAQLLTEYFHKKDIPYMYLDFPNYSSFFGQIIAKFLRGELGTLEEVSPYVASLLFALDRNAMRDQIAEALDKGKIIIMNRYVTSNVAHQGSKFSNQKEREEFVEWLQTLEYTIHGLPKEDIVIYLKVPWQTSHHLTSQKSDREYLKGKKTDIQEQDIEHRKSTEQMYNYLAETSPGWNTIFCVEHDTIISKEKIHDQIVDLLQKKVLFHNLWTKNS